MKKLSLILAGILACFLLYNPGASIAEQTAEPGIDAGSPAPISDSINAAGYQRIAESDNLILFYNGDPSAIRVQDKRSGFVWGSSVDEEYYGEKPIKIVSQNMNSLLNFSVTDFDKAYIITSLAAQEDRLSAEMPIENGIRIGYYFPKYQIGFTLDIWLENNDLHLKVPAESIVEDGIYGLAGISLLPFFGASKNDEDGYIFYPDGCGALYKFKGIDYSRPKQYSFSVYSEAKVDLKLYEENGIQGIKPVMLPVFGLKRGNNAYVAIISEGDCDAFINLSLSGYVADINRIASEFRYRKEYIYTNSDGKSTPLYERAMERTDRAVIYRFLTGDDADYSGMANAYRDYLVDNGGIAGVISDKDDIPLGLDLFMGVKEERLLFDKYIAMTTFDQAEAILSDFIEQGAENLLVNLVGWMQKGYGEYPAHLPPNRRLGGAGGLKRLAEFAQSRGIRLMLQDNFVNAKSNSRGFSKRNDTVLSEPGMVITNEDKDEFLLNPGRSWKRYSSDYIPRVDRLGVDGLSFEVFGSLIYHDYNRSFPVSRRDTAEYWKAFMNESRSKLGYAAVYGGNAYVLSAADRLFDIPVESSGYFYTDETIPFYQMVVHGMVPYSSEPGNLFHDFEAQKLKWVEYGCMPYFELTYENSNLLKYTDYNGLFTSQYSDWVDAATEIYREFNERLGDTWPAVMIEHENIAPDVYRVLYENGIRVYVNYSSSAVTADGYELKPQDYLVVDQGGDFK